MIRYLALTFTIITVLALPVYAGGVDVGKVDNPSSQRMIPPTTAGGAEMAPVESLADDKALAEPEEMMITTSPMPPLIRKVTVLIESTPANSGIEVDGVFIGVTPVQVSLKEGVHMMKVSKAGYLAWARTVKAYNGLYINPTLVQESTRKQDITESASAK